MGEGRVVTIENYHLIHEKKTKKKSTNEDENTVKKEEKDT